MIAIRKLQNHCVCPVAVVIVIPFSRIDRPGLRPIHPSGVNSIWYLPAKGTAPRQDSGRDRPLSYVTENRDSTGLTWKISSSSHYAELNLHNLLKHRSRYEPADSDPLTTSPSRPLSELGHHCHYLPPPTTVPLPSSTTPPHPHESSTTTVCSPLLSFSLTLTAWT